MKNTADKIGWMAAGFLLANISLFCVMFRAPKKRWNQEQYDCAVVCGCRVNDDGTPSDTLKSRVEKAAELWKAKKVRYLIMSGAAVSNSQVEAKAMEQYARRLGVPKEYILKEEQAVSTYHNLLHSCKMMKEHDFKDCVVVTSGWHLRKTDHYARRQGVPYVTAAARSPKSQKIYRIIWLHVKTNVHMYLNMWRGYY